MTGEDEFRMVSLSREQRDAIENMLAQFYDLNKVGDVVGAWDKAPESAWAEIADEFRRHRCKDGNCFAETVLMRLGALSLPSGPFDGVQS